MIDLSMTTALYLYMICYFLGFIFMMMLYRFIDQKEKRYLFFFLFFTFCFLGALILIYRENLGKFFGVLIPNLLIILGLIMLSIGCRKIYHLKLKYMFYYILVMMFLILFIIMLYVYQNIYIRVYILNATAIIILVDILYHLNLYKQKKNHEVMTLAIFIMMITIVARTINFIVNGETSHQFLLFKYDPFFIVLIGISNLFVIPGVLSIIKGELEQNLMNLSFVDVLTGLENRRGLINSSEFMWKKNENSQKPISICMIDIDDFKIFNDKFGHVYGDQILISVANAIKKVLDPKKHVISRYGGEEFVIIFEDCDFDKANLITESIHHEVSKCGYYIDDLKTMPLSISMGYVTLYNMNQMDFDSALEIADQKMYESKRQGKNRTIGTSIK